VPWNKIPGFRNAGIRSANEPAYKTLVEHYNLNHPGKPWRHAGTANQLRSQRERMFTKKKADLAKKAAEARKFKAANAKIR